MYLLVYYSLDIKLQRRTEALLGKLDRIWGINSKGHGGMEGNERSYRIEWELLSKENSLMNKWHSSIVA